MADLLIRPRELGDDVWIRGLYARCHPRWPERPREWFTAYPTLVAEKGRGRIVGFTSFSVNGLSGMTMLQGQDVCVAPDCQGQGIGGQLHRARVIIGHDVGATMFSGMTQLDNLAMLRIFLACGYHQCQTFPRYFPGGEDGLLYLGPVVL